MPGDRRSGNSFCAPVMACPLSHNDLLLLQLHSHSVVFEPQCLPKLLARHIAAEHFKYNSPAVWKNLCPKQSHRGPAMPPPPATLPDKKLTQVNFLITIFAKKCIPHNFPLRLEHHRTLIVRTNPPRHPLFQFHQPHRVTMPLIPDQAQVHRRQLRRITTNSIPP